MQLWAATTGAGHLRSPSFGTRRYKNVKPANKDSLGMSLESLKLLKQPHAFTNFVVGVD
jgi:hypothetical protein